MQELHNEVISGLHDRTYGGRVDGLLLDQCTFEACSLSMVELPAQRTVVSNLVVQGCTATACHIGPAIFDGVIVDGLRTQGNPLLIHGAVYQHVILRGNIGRLVLSNDPLPSLLQSEQSRQSTIQAFRAANAVYYANVDWAIDISGAVCQELDIRGVPGTLIRRDQETQVLLTREKAEQGEWREIDFRCGVFPFTIEAFLAQHTDSTVLVAPRKNKRFRDYMYDLDLLRRAKIVEQD